MREVAARVHVAAPVPVVWAAVTDWPRQGEWMIGTRVAVVAGDGRSVGSRLFGFTGLGDVGFLDELEIVEWTPPHRCRARHLGTLLRGSAEFDVSADGSGSVVRWTERLEPPLGVLGAVGLRVLGPVLVLGMRRSLRRLAAVVTRPAG
ncbi:MAG TPA: SRPBCC family protein [Actinophytocola sp.]|uniref:SRPBCC family protein n=1 Tax=Actinophytocola sp. TaxID=1872138 RepID=UPI002DDD0F86|nr:SRPBCC family protein [Actinophytocola sp.]HEV2781118.1 SRPBCC family protein [Actinophytocola sp.]